MTNSLHSVRLFLVAPAFAALLGGCGSSGSSFQDPTVTPASLPASLPASGPASPETETPSPVAATPAAAPVPVRPLAPGRPAAVKPPPARPAAVMPKPAAPRPSPKAAVYYANCAAARAAGVAPLHRGQPGYRSGLDRDSDGVACET